MFALDRSELQAKTLTVIFLSVGLSCTPSFSFTYIGAHRICVETPDYNTNNYFQPSEKHHTAFKQSILIDQIDESSSVHMFIDHAEEKQELAWYTGFGFTFNGPNTS